MAGMEMCTWPDCLTEAQRVELARTLDGEDAPAAPDQRVLCACDEAPPNEVEIENG